MADGGSIITVATRKTATRYHADRAAAERLRSSTASTTAALDDDAAADLDARLREAIGLADRIVREANASWERGKLSPFLVGILDNVTRQDQTTRLILRFLVAIDEASRLPFIANKAGHVAFRVAIFDAPSGRRASLPAGQKAIEQAIVEWPKGRGASKKWSALAASVRLVLRRDIESETLKKLWMRARK